MVRARNSDVLPGLHGKRVIVTGGASGIGLAISERFARHGAIVGINYLPSDPRGPEAVQRLVSEGHNVLRVEADVGDEQSVITAFDAYRSQVGAPDVLVSNAGVAEHIDFQELSAESWERMLRVHVMGARNSIHAVLPDMVASGFGRIIITASDLAFVGGPRLTHYSAAKGALVAFAKALAREVAHHGITVNCVAPGPVETELLTAYPDEYNEANRMAIPLQRWGTPQEIAWSYAFLASDAASWYTGQTLAPNGGGVM